jgi:hypothetical protein
MVSGRETTLALTLKISPSGPVLRKAITQIHAVDRG